jgi:hypothetical protein
VAFGSDVAQELTVNRNWFTLGPQKAILVAIHWWEEEEKSKKFL